MMADPLPDQPSSSSLALQAAADRLQDLLTHLAQHYPPTTDTDRSLFLEKFDQSLQAMPETVETLVAGGLNPIQLACARAEVPPALVRRLYDRMTRIYEER